MCACVCVCVCVCGCMCVSPILWNDLWGLTYKQLKFSFQQIFNTSLNTFSLAFGNVHCYWYSNLPPNLSISFHFFLCVKEDAIEPCIENLLDINNTPFIVTFTVSLNNLFILSSASGRVAKPIKKLSCVSEAC